MRPLIRNERLARLTLVIVGSLICGVGINAFLVPQDLLTAGVAGFAVLISYLVPVSAGVLLFLMNIPIFILGWRIIDRSFALWSMLGMVGLSVALWLTKDLAALNLVKDGYLALGTGATLSGLGAGLVFRARATQGGTDIIATIIRRFWAIELSPLFFGLNASVVLLLAFTAGLEKALATTVVILIESIVVEKAIIGIDSSKALIVITRCPKEVANALMHRVGRGVTILNGKGGYTGDPKEILYSIVSTRQLAVARQVIRDVDPKAFTTIHNVTEVLGEGFKELPI